MARVSSASTSSDSSLPTAHSYVRETAQHLWENLPGVLLAGAFFTAISAPALVLFLAGAAGPGLVLALVTVAPAWSALLAQESKFVSDRVSSTRNLLTSFRRHWRSSVQLATIMALPCFSARFLFASIDGPGASPSFWLALAANLVALLLMAPLALYAFPLLVMRESGPLTVLRDAVILASRHVVNTIGLLAMGLLFGLAIVYLSVALWLLLPAVWGIFIVNNCRLVAGEELARA